MKFTKKVGDTSTIRKVWSDSKKSHFGTVGTVQDLLKARILEYADYPGETWCFIHEATGKAWFRASREDAVNAFFKTERR